MTRFGCWCMAVLSTGGALSTDRPVTSIVLGVIALAWLRCAAREATRSSSSVLFR